MGGGKKSSVDTFSPTLRVAIGAGETLTYMFLSGGQVSPLFAIWYRGVSKRQTESYQKQEPINMQGAARNNN